MDKTRVELMELFRDLYFPDGATSKAMTNYMIRDLVCTPFDGNYGTTAGWVICVNSSPPKGTLLVLDSGYAIFYISAAGTKAKRVTGSRKVQTIKAFYKKHLEHREKAVTLKAECLEAVS